MQGRKLAAYVAQRVADGGALWCFAYGSLMWRLPPGCVAVRTARATLLGHRRSFCVPSLTYRGTPQRPGLALGLEPSDPADACEGVALCLGEASVAAAIRSLETIDSQEMVDDHSPPVYVRSELQLHLAGSEGEWPTTVSAMAYVANPAACVPRAMPVAERAGVIAAARGERGPNREYIEQTCAQLHGLQVHDAHVESVAHMVAQLVAARR